jgi:hypothetical protein
MKYRITLLDQGGDAPVGRRLAGLLKTAWRRFGFKCVEAVEVVEDEHKKQPGAVKALGERGD